MMVYVSKYFPPTFRQLPADQAFVVGIPFLWSGRQYQPGEPFDRGQGTLAQVRRLYNGRKLAPAPPSGMPSLAAAGSSLAAAAPLTVRHIGHGKYCVMQGDARIGDPTDKESAERELAMLSE